MYRFFIPTIYTQNSNTLFLILEQGGYARLKTIIEQEKNNARRKNIPTILVDAGDFLEGSLFYMVDSGETSFKLHNAMGYEAVTLGNHDYLMGAKGLDRLLNNMQNQIRFTLLAANIDFNVEINDYVTPIRE